MTNKLLNEKTFKNIIDFLNKFNFYAAITANDGTVIWRTNNFNKLFEQELLDKNIFKILNKKKSQQDFYTFGQFTGIIKKISFQPTESKHNRLILFIPIESEGIPIERNKVKNSAHDLSNLFSGILNSLQMLKQTQKTEDKPAFYETIESNVNQAAEMIEDLLITDDNFSGIHRKLNVTKLVKDFYKSFNSTLPNSIKMKLDIDKNLYPVIGRYTLLHRALMNLSMNAKESIVNEGTIELSARNSIIKSNNIQGLDLLETKYVIISIKDNGSGIEKEKIEKIFQQGFSTKRRNRESGLGLSIVKKIIEAHQGKIEVSSIAGKGSEFTIYLPAVDNPAVDHITNKLKDNKKAKIIVAEDEDTLLELLSDLLNSYGFSVLQAHNGKDVMKILESNSDVSLFIIDRKMPEMDGLTCIKEINRTGIKAPIILVSGSQNINEKKFEEKIEVTKILNKPYDFEDLLQIINELLNDRN